MNQHIAEVVVGNEIELRHWQNRHLPIFGSFIGYDLLLFLIEAHLRGVSYSLKDVFLGLAYSEGALRIFIRRLESGGWIRLETRDGDRRNRKIIVEQKLEGLMTTYFMTIRQKSGSYV